MITDIKKPDRFSFLNTVKSHGWSELPAFSFNPETEKLGAVFTLKNSDLPILASVYDAGKVVRIETRDISIPEQEEIASCVSRVLRLGEPLDGFYTKIAEVEKFNWIIEIGAGRLLRSQSVFEDLVKTICTTNCSWGATRSMLNNLVENLGEKTDEGIRAFPSIERIATENEDFYRNVMRAGYRAPYFPEIARTVQEGIIDPESWLDSELPTVELKREIKKVKGVGDYAAENILKLIGRYDGLALDSWLRARFFERYRNGESCSDLEIEEFYEEFGEYKGLVIWLDMSKNYLN